MWDVEVGDVAHTLTMDAAEEFYLFTLLVVEIVPQDAVDRSR